MKVRSIEFNLAVQGSGVPLIWGHGLMGSMAAEDRFGFLNWLTIGKSATVIRYDARGHGESQPSDDPADYSWPSLSQDMAAIMEALGHSRYLAGGQSMGCATTLYAGRAKPDRVKGMILMNPPTAWETRAAQSSVYDTMARAVETGGIDRLVQLMKESPSAIEWLAKERPDLAESGIENIAKFDPRTLVTILKGAKLSNFPPREEIAAIRIPALILAWVGDPVHPVETADSLHALLPDSTLIVAENLPEVLTWSDRIREFIETCR